jgi:hypothetical protein
VALRRDNGGHPGRWSALALPPKTYAGAPYLRQLPCGGTVLVFQRSDDGELSHSQIAAAVGDARAQAFSGARGPFRNARKAQLWPALCVTARGQFARWRARRSTVSVASGVSKEG